MAAWTVYLGGMLLFVLNVGDDIRENKSDDPNLDVLKRTKPGRILLTIGLLGYSIIWPYWALRALRRWSAIRVERLSVKLKEKGEELQNRDGE